MNGLAVRRMRLTGKPLDELLETIDLVEVVDHDQPDLVLQGHAQLGFGLGVAVHHDPLGRETGVQCQMELTAGGDVAPQALLGEQSQHGGAGKRLGSKHNIEVLMAGGGTGLDECPRPRA